jgi:hypothetical protein
MLAHVTKAQGRAFLDSIPHSEHAVLARAWNDAKEKGWITETDLNRN